MSVYGFDYSNIFFLLSKNAVMPVANSANNPSVNTLPTQTDFNTFYQYNPALPYFGNPNIPVNSTQATLSSSFPDWISTLNNNLDLRGYYLSTDAVCYTIPAITTVAGSSYCQIFNWTTDVISTTSTITGYQVAYTT